LYKFTKVVFTDMMFDIAHNLFASNVCLSIWPSSHLKSEMPRIGIWFGLFCDGPYYSNSSLLN